MYAQHFNFSDLPFSIAPNPRYVYLSPQHREALAHLLYGIGVGGGFVVLTGEVGTGKTTLCRCLLESLPEDVEIAVIFNPRLNPKELLAAICDELRIVYPQRASLKQLIDVLNHHLLEVHARGKRTVVLIDEAQNLSFDVLEQIRLLTNLETNDTKLMQIILIGQPELNDVLKRRNLRQLAQRITARYHLRPLSVSETKAYILHRLAVSGGKTDIFNSAAIAKIYRLSGGIPRVVNLICDRALLGAYALGKPDVNRAVVRKAAKEVLPVVESGPGYVAAVGMAAILVLVLAIASLAYFKIIPDLVPDKLPEKLAAVTPQPQLPQTLPQQPSLPPAILAEPAVKAAVVAAQPPKVTPLPVQPSFAQLAANSGATQNSALAQLFSLWGQELSAEPGKECRFAETKGLRCLFQTGSWMQLRSLGLPAVLVFKMNGGGKRYALLRGIEGDKVRLMLGEQSYVFDATEFLPFWQGGAVLLWKPPLDNLQRIKPGARGEAVRWLRRQLGAETEPRREMSYDRSLQVTVIAYQKARGLNPDGVVRAQTLIHLSRNANDPSLFQAGPQPQPAAK